MMNDGLEVVPRWAIEAFGRAWRRQRQCVDDQGPASWQRARWPRSRLLQLSLGGQDTVHHRIFCARGNVANILESFGVHADDVIAHDCDPTRARPENCPNRLALRRPDGCHVFN